MKRILLVEGDESITLRLAGMLAGGGYDVATAADGGEALEMVKGGAAIDLLLADIDLGAGINGPSLAGKILRERTLPVVFLLDSGGRDMADAAGSIPHCGCVARDSGEAVLLAALTTAFSLFMARMDLLDRDRRHAAALETIGESEHRLKRIMDNVKDMIFRMTIPEGRYEYMNPASVAITGYTPEEFYRDPLMVKKLIHPEWHEYFDGQWKRILEGDPPPVYDYRILHRSGEERWVSQKNVFVRNGEGRITVIEGIVTDVTDRVLSEERRQAAEKALRESEEMFRGIAEQLSDMIFITDSRGILVYVSPASLGLFGKRQEEMEGQGFTEFLREDQIQVAVPAFARVIESGQPQETIVLMMKRSDGSEFFGELVAKQCSYGGGSQGTLGLVRDITGRRRAEEALARSAEDKDTLLRELQHRVKNSIGMISAVVDLESMRIEDESVRGLLKSIRDRIAALSALYDLLFRSHGADRVQLHDYLDHICEYLVHTYLAGSDRITVRKNFDPVTVTMRAAVPLGIIVNELFTNSLKYAFPEDRHGAISITLQRNESGVILQVVDDGVGLPGEPGSQDGRGLGSVLIRLLTRQLHGNMEYRAGNGASFTITVPLSPQDMKSP